MASSTISARWLSVMLEAAENVRISVRKALLNRGSLETPALKQKLDDEAQKAIRQTLTESGIPVRVISEEGDYTLGSKGPFLIVDPLDGTTNMARGIPFACTSLALSDIPRLSGLVIGLVKDLYTGDVYKAERNRGAWRSGKRIAPSRSRHLSNAIVSLDISKGTPVEGVERLITSAGHIRQMGSAALSLCHLASGNIDAHIDVRGKLRVTDVAAGILILEEAGGAIRIDGATGSDIGLSRESTLKLVAASSPWTLEEVLGTLS